MEKHQETTGNPFAAMRDDMIAEYEKARNEWIEFTSQIDSRTDGPEKIVMVKEGLKLMDKMDEIEAEIHTLECEQVEHQLGKTLLQLGVACYNTMLANQRAWKEAELARLDDLRKKGVAYQERMKQINGERIKSILAVDKGDISLKDIELKPITQWLEPITGYNKLKELGVTEFVRRNFSFIYNVKK